MTYPSDLTGLRFGRLVVLGPAERHGRRREGFWACRCDCGGESVVPRSNLTTGHTRSCGCGAPMLADLTGQRFGRLTALRLHPALVRGLRVWECRCDCGTGPVLVPVSALRNGNTRSCGCLQRERARRTGSTLGGARTRDLVCPHCRTSFAGTNRQIYCSRVCKEAAQLVAREERPCAFCGRPFHGRADQEYCSDACRHEFGSRYRGARGKTAPTGGPAPLARQLADAAEELERKTDEHR